MTKPTSLQVERLNILFNMTREQIQWLSVNGRLVHYKSIDFFEPRDSWMPTDIQMNDGSAIRETNGVADIALSDGTDMRVVIDEYYQCLRPSGRILHSMTGILVIR